MQVRWLIHPLVRHRLIHVRHRHDLRPDRDLLPYKPVGITAAVITFVMPHTYIMPQLQQLPLFPPRRFLKHLGADRSMGLHYFKLFCGKPPRLIQYLLINGDLPDVVEHGSYTDHSYLRFVQIIFVCLLHQLVEEHLCNDAHMQYMEAALTVPELHDIAQDLHHLPALLLPLVDLLRDHALQHLLLGMEHDRIVRFMVDDFKIKRSDDIVCNAHIIRLAYVF